MDSNKDGKLTLEEMQAFMHRAAPTIRAIDEQTANTHVGYLTEIVFSSRFIEWSRDREIKHERGSQKVRPRIAPRPRARRRGTSARSAVAVILARLARLSNPL